MIAAYVTVSLLSIFAYFHFVNNNTTQQVYFSIITLFEFSCFCYFIWLHIKKRKLRQVIALAWAAFTLFIIAHTLFFKVKIDSIPIGVETIIILAFSAYFLFEQINNPENLFIYNDFRFWIIIAFMFYLSGSFFTYIFADYIKMGDEQLNQFWNLTHVFNTLKNILFSIGILMSVQRPTFPSPPAESTKSYLDLT